MSERPGQASVQYGDLKGEVAADLFNDLGKKTDIQEIARDFGWEGKGRVVGINLSIGERRYEDDTSDCFYLTLQVVDEFDIEKLTDEIERSGCLDIREHTIRDVDILKVIKYFKRFSVGLFDRLISPKEIIVVGRD